MFIILIGIFMAIVGVRLLFTSVIFYSKFGVYLNFGQYHYIFAVAFIIVGIVFIYVGLNKTGNT